MKKMLLIVAAAVVAMAVQAQAASYYQTATTNTVTVATGKFVVRGILINTEDSTAGNTYLTVYDATTVKDRIVITTNTYSRVVDYTPFGGLVVGTSLKIKSDAMGAKQHVTVIYGGTQ